jgi:hypothetical protein
LATARGLLRHPQRVAGFNRNGWLVCVGSTGWNGSESPAALPRIPQTDRTLPRTASEHLPRRVVGWIVSDVEYVLRIISASLGLPWHPLIGL